MRKKRHKANDSRLLTARAAKDIDIKAMGVLGISTLVLMENAGRAVTEEACGSTRSKKMLRCAIFCGRGNNGADGFVAARHLLIYGIRPDIFLAGRIKDVDNDAGINLEILLKLKQKIVEVEEENLVLSLIHI